MTKIFDDKKPLTRFMQPGVTTPEQFLRAFQKDILEAAGSKDRWGPMEFGLMIATITRLLGNEDELKVLMVAAQQEWPDGNW